jgi:tetratricopeptide (TPR) repeat protein
MTSKKKTNDKSNNRYSTQNLSSENKNGLAIKLPLIPLFIVLAITFLVFLNVLDNGFVNWDDDKNFYENPLVINFGVEGYIQSISDIFTTSIIGNYNPLSILSLCIDKMMYGFDNKAGWHLTNLFLHLICVFFVFRISLQLGLNWKGAFVTALLFGIHPMRVESVAWITERKDVLYGSFYLAAFYLYLKQKIRYSSKRNLFIFILFVLSLLSKIQAVTLPLTFLVADYLLDDKLTWKTIKSKIPYFAISLIFGIIGIIILNAEGSLNTVQTTYPLWVRPFIGSYSLLVYFVKAVIPFRLSPVYPYPSELPSYIFASMAFIPVLLGLLWYSYRRNAKFIVFGLGFFLVNIIFLLQVLGAGQGFLADRFTYIPYFGFFFIAGYYVDRFQNSFKYNNFFSYGVMAICLAYSWMTYNQNKIWKDSDTLWTHVLRYYQNITLPWGNRANFRRDAGRFSEAILDYNKAISLQPSAQTFNSRARLYFDSGNSIDTLKLALADYNSAIGLDSTEGEFYSNRGATYARLGDFPSAINNFNKSIDLNPNYQTSYLNRSVLFSQVGEYQKALDDILYYLRFDKFNADIIYEASRCYYQLKQYPEALDFVNRAISQKNNKGLYYYQRALVQYNLANTAGAVSDIAMARKLGYTDIDVGFEANLLKQ